MKRALELDLTSRPGPISSGACPQLYIMMVGHMHDVLYVHPVAPGVGQPWKKWPVPDLLSLLLV